MSGYLAIVAARFRALLQYRAAALGGLFTQIFFGFVRISILHAFYAAGGSPPLRLDDATGYVWLSQATLLLIPWRGDEDVAEQIRSGNVVYELTRPLDLYGVWFARAFALRTAPVFLRMLPMFAFAMLLLPAGWQLQPPQSAAALAVWLASFAGAVLVASALTTLMSVSMMWTISGDGVPMLLATSATMFGGLIVPLPLFPDWAQPILHALPFACILDHPARLFTGDLAVGDAPWVLVRQLVWTALLVGLGRYLVGRGVRRMVVQGG